MARGTRSLSLCAIVLAGTACAAKIQPATIQDIQTAARVKTAIVNDPALGVYPIEVRVARGVVRLSGHVPSEALVRQAVTLAGSVTGVLEVRSELRVGGESTPRAAPPNAAVEEPAGARQAELDPRLRRRLLGVGASFGWNGPSAGQLGSTTGIGPAFRFGTGSGLGLSIGFGWFGADLHSGPSSETRLARIRIRPIMGGIGYTVGRRGVTTTFALVAGPAVNGLSPDAPEAGEFAAKIGNSFAWRPGISVWLDTSSRVALNLSGAYLVTRPQLTRFQDGGLVTDTLRADALLVRVGGVYKVF
jgi:hypothetical protein